MLKLTEFYRVTFRKKVYLTIDEPQRDLDHWINRYSKTRIHQGKRSKKIHMETFRENLDLAKEKVWNMNGEDVLTIAS